jgi:autotransporter-associated beta strand protein
VISNGTATMTLTKSNSSVWTLSGNSTYTGGTTINGGTLLVNNTTGSGTGSGSVTVNGGTLGGTGTITTTGTIQVNNGGNLAPGASAGTLTIGATGGVNLGSMGAGALKFELGATGDQVKVTSGTLTLGQLDFGDFTFTPLSGITAGTYTLFDAASTMAATIGTASGTIPGFNATLTMDNTTNFDIYLTLTAAGTPGDYNNDTKVNAADYVTWRKDQGNNGGANGYATWRENFSLTSGSGSPLSGAGSAVPEPGVGLLACCGLALLAMRGSGARQRRTCV